MKKLIAYDIEVFLHDALVVFKDLNKNPIIFFHNDFEGILDLIKDYTLIGYNNYSYDDYILTKMIAGWSPEQIKMLNDKIIKGQEFEKHLDSHIDSIDCFQQIDISLPSLKKIEGNMGKKIFESNISFDIDRRLTADEFMEVLKYCSYDVDTTIDIYKHREHSYFESKNKLLEMYGNEKAKRWNTTTISANILLNKPLPKWSSVRVDEELLELVPPDVRDMWMQANSIGTNIKKKYINMERFNNEIQFGFGGLHGTHKSKKRFEDIKLLDVSSMYPSIIINMNALGTSTKKYEDMMKKRLEIKHKDKTLSDALKLVLNSVYGNLKNEYSLLNNPKAAISVCIYGQIALYELCSRLSAIGEIININTDGVAFITDDKRYKEIWKDWEKEFNLTLEEENYGLFIQKDVNNYIAVKDVKLKGEYGKIILKDNMKVKGADVGRYFSDKLFSNNNARIIDIAIVDYLVNKTDVLDTLLYHIDEPKLFQYILKAGGTYLGTFDEDGKKYNNVNRVFASKKKDYVLLQKKRHDGGLVRFADVPEKMFLWNDDLDKLKDFSEIVDLNHYYQIINKKLERWR